jgi:hypothetical protein
MCVRLIATGLQSRAFVGMFVGTVTDARDNPILAGEAPEDLLMRRADWVL